MGVIRVTGGVWRGRKLRTPRGDATRPSSDQYRQSLMTLLGDRLDEARVLDLFAGSGALGIECLSRGAASVVAIERARDPLQVIRRNADDLGIDPAMLRVVRGDAYRPRAPGPFDIVFVAPPYPQFRTDGHRVRRVTAELRERLAEGGVIVVQAGTGDFHADGLPGLVVADERQYGITTFWFLEAGPSDRDRDRDPGPDAGSGG
jgi:16S rRNA (guanine966-N2)-methyltransferase